MRALHSHFVIEARRFFSCRNTVVFLLFLVLCLYFVRDGVHEYRRAVENKEAFLQVEKDNSVQFVTYSQYGLYGFRLMFLPSPLSALSAYSGTVPELTAFVDSGVRLRLYQPILGKNLYRGLSPGSMDFSGLVLLFGSLFALVYGFGAFRPREYTRYLASLLGRQSLYFRVVGARLMLLTLLYFFTFGSSIVLMRLYGVALTAGAYMHLGIYGFVSLGMLVFFFLAGTAAGCMQSKTSGIIVLAAVWFVLVFLAPGTISRIAAGEAGKMTSVYQLEQQKLKILSDFEKQALERSRRYGEPEAKKESDRREAERYWNGQMKQIRAIEQQLETESGKHVAVFQALSLLFPTSFYTAVSGEIDSRGYENVLAFYAYAGDLRVRFVRYYFDKKYHSNYAPVEPFVKGDENIFYARGRLPAGTGVGGVLMLFYIAGLWVFSYYRYTGFLFAVSGGDTAADDLDLELKTGETYVLLTGGAGVGERLYRFFCGRDRSFEGRVRLAGSGIEAGGDAGVERDFVYFCRTVDIPGDIRVGDFINLIGHGVRASRKAVSELYLRLGIDHIEDRCVGSLEHTERARVMVETSRLTGARVYMFYHFAAGMPAGFAEFFTEELQALKSHGIAILYLTGDVLLASRIGDSAGSLQPGAEGPDVFK